MQQKRVKKKEWKRQKYRACDSQDDYLLVLLGLEETEDVIRERKRDEPNRERVTGCEKLKEIK